MSWLAPYFSKPGKQLNENPDSDAVDFMFVIKHDSGSVKLDAG